MAIVFWSVIEPIPEYPYITTCGAVNLIRSGPSVGYAAVSFAFPKNNSEASLMASCCLSEIIV